MALFSSQPQGRCVESFGESQFCHRQGCCAPQCKAYKCSDGFAPNVAKDSFRNRLWLYQAHQSSTYHINLYHTIYVHIIMYLFKKVSFLRKVKSNNSSFSQTLHVPASHCVVVYHILCLVVRADACLQFAG